jgi:hypothetical protein
VLKQKTAFNALGYIKQSPVLEDYYFISLHPLSWLNMDPCWFKSADFRHINKLANFFSREFDLQSCGVLRESERLAVAEQFHLSDFSLRTRLDEAEH